MPDLMALLQGFSLFDVHERELATLEFLESLATLDPRECLATPDTLIADPEILDPGLRSIIWAP
jgi:hypothetical protein